MLAAKEVTRLVIGYELVGIFKDIGRYVEEKPDISFFNHLGPSVELRRDLAELEYDQFLLSNNLLTPEAALEVFQKQQNLPEETQELLY